MALLCAHTESSALRRHGQNLTAFVAHDAVRRRGLGGPVMKHLGPVISLLAALMAAESTVAQAQDMPAEITVLSVLTIAKEAAESASGEWHRAQLRVRVARSIEATGRTDAFGKYVGDADDRLDAINRPPAGADRRLLDANARNQELRREARRSVLRGDGNNAEALLRQCQWVSHWDMCETRDPFVSMQLLIWEASGGRVDAALQRLRSAGWWNEAWRATAAMHVARGLIGAGRRSEGLEILRIAHPPGADFDPCVVWAESIGTGGEIRRLACEGQVDTAIAKAVRMNHIAMRATALAIAAEGMMGIPGYSDERLEPRVW